MVCRQLEKRTPCPASKSVTDLHLQLRALYQKICSQDCNYIWIRSWPTEILSLSCRFCCSLRKGLVFMNLLISLWSTLATDLVKHTKMAKQWKTFAKCAIATLKKKLIPFPIGKAKRPQHYKGVYEGKTVLPIQSDDPKAIWKGCMELNYSM